MDKATLQRIVRGNKKRGRIIDRRRFKVTIPADGTSTVVAPRNATGTLFKSKVQIAPADPLRDAAYNSKMGGDVLVGRDKGAVILQLTLEERATCPRSCPHWRTCYGNNAPFTPRWQPGPHLEAMIARQVAELTEVGPIKVRLHYLGDFYSVDYVHFWLDLMRKHEPLSVFGFTAYGPDTEIGAAVKSGRSEFRKRWAIRHSGMARPWGSFSIDYPTEKKLIGDAVVCPEQRHANDGTGKPVHCGNCGACWETNRCIVFIEH